ncbi:host attachment protein [Agaricicola taiwanensis]|uniref:Host attachment protein n=1 Tax=Agaricicola taiwanensis TaxID=591372 RepID=A0A8J2YLF3_9RHOB|nr:host attachment family protein [Agaricicola taiwanensis]GGE50889.1 host attachment protein [Agaricicola taiwanensis]
MSDVRIPYNALVLVADGEKALFLRNKGDAINLNLTIDPALEEDNSGSERRAVTQSDLQSSGEDGFAADVAERLFKAANDNVFDQLVVVAGPNLLGVLRKEMHQEVTRRIVGEVPKTLTTRDLGDIEKVLSVR